MIDLNINTLVPLLIGNLLMAVGTLSLSLMLWSGYRSNTFKYLPENRPVVYLNGLVLFVLGIDALFTEVSLLMGHFYLAAVWKFLCGSIAMIAAVFLFQHIYKR